MKVFADFDHGMSAYDGAVYDGEQWRGQFSGRTLREIREGCPKVMLMDAGIFISVMERKSTTDPIEITEGEFILALECLPPCGWDRFGNTESFYSSEALCGNVTAHYVRLKDRYFSFYAPAMPAHSTRLAKVLKWREERFKVSNLPEPLREAVEAWVRRFRTTWKRHLRTHWEFGTPAAGLQEHAAALRKLRNEYGPEWLEGAVVQ